MITASQASGVTASNTGDVVVSVVGGRIPAMSTITSLDATAMSAAGYLEHLAADGARVRAAATDLRAPVPACPGWDVADLLRHLAEVYVDKTIAVRTGAAAGDGAWRAELAQNPDPLGGFDRALAELQAELAARPSDQVTWTWWPPDQTVGFWQRRMAQETVVHRWDLQQATGTPTELDPRLAVDGVDELLGWLTYPVEAPDPRAYGRVLVATGGHRWLVTQAPGPFVVTGASGGAVVADTEVTGEPAQVLLWLWGRAADDQIELTGDTDVLAGLGRRLTALRD